MTDSVLLIHDDPGSLGSLGGRFEQAGCEVLRESGLDAGLTLAERMRPDVVCVATQVAERAPEKLTRLAAREAPVLVFGERIDPAAAMKVLAAGGRVVEAADDSVV